MDREEVVKRLTEQTGERDDGRKTVPCARALALAKDCGVSVKEIGDICNEENIRIVACQLGCFK